ncbi:ABC1 family-domain-containing protein [Cladochytrium replicatum]|nr:ABC1 family-domain-containing protein [Cladochytrium replicatum]
MAAVWRPFASALAQGSNCLMSHSSIKNKLPVSFIARSSYPNAVFRCRSFSSRANEPSARRRRGSRFLKFSGYLGLAAFGVWVADRYLYASTVERNVRTVIAGAIVSLDYYFHFNVDNAENIDDLHLRSAKRILETCQKNAGLYIKFGQQIASLNGVSPPAYSNTFRVLYDMAPPIPIDVVRQIICSELNISDFNEIFQWFENGPIASASVASVHRARLRDGTPVAVKIQKPEISIQMEWDLATFELVLRCIEWFFELPLSWTAKTIKTHMRQEVDFVNEARNAAEAAKYISENSRLSSRAYVPKVYNEYTTQRVMVMEWIDGTKFQDLPKQSSFNTTEVVETMVDVFSDQIFNRGFVHGDPHQGNILVRPNPSNPKRPQLVLLDHGLYVRCRDEFRHDYALFWKSLFTRDMPTLTQIATSWGIGDVELFASAQLQRNWTATNPVHVSHKVSATEMFQKQKEMQARLKNYLADTDRLPPELVFIGRNLNIVRANNKYMGSPVNRINRMANAAVAALGDDWSVWTTRSELEKQRAMAKQSSYFSIDSWVRAVSFVVKSQYNYWNFQAVMFASTLAFEVVQFWQKLNAVLFGVRAVGFEDVLDAQLRKQIEKQYGVVLDENVFDA